ncbi:MAG: Fic family protein [Candidatus Pacebacteria bacterium]|nr:Fic family protein [Candidatus Paceibacterota bacterium]
MVQYIAEESLELIFALISERYSKIEEVPHYSTEAGFKKFCSVLLQAEEDSYYPSVLDKAMYLLIGINKGHFFSNGNKRLALVITTVFLGINDLWLKAETKERYRGILENLFPEYAQWGDFEEFTSTDFATYNLSIMIADSGVYGISHDELKRRVRTFLEQSTETFTISKA